MRKGSSSVCLNCEESDGEDDQLTQAEEEQKRQEEQQRRVDEEKRKEELAFVEKMRQKELQERQKTLATPNVTVQPQQPPTNSNQDIKQQIRQLYLQTILEEFQNIRQNTQLTTSERLNQMTDLLTQTGLNWSDLAK